MRAARERSFVMLRSALPRAQTALLTLGTDQCSRRRMSMIMSTLWPNCSSTNIFHGNECRFTNNFHHICCFKGSIVSAGASGSDSYCHAYKALSGRNPEVVSLAMRAGQLPCFPSQKGATDSLALAAPKRYKDVSAGYRSRHREHNIFFEEAGLSRTDTQGT